jgi:predicted DNA-binding transcriptional regulator AlpA
MSATPVTASDLMTARDVARCLSVSERTVWRWTRLGILPPPVRPSRRSTRWRAGDVRRFLDSLSPPSPVSA